MGILLLDGHFDKGCLRLHLCRASDLALARRMRVGCVE